MEFGFAETVITIGGGVAILAPILLAVEGRQALPIIVSICLIVSAGAVLATQQNVFGQLFAGIVWLGAIVVGAVSQAANFIIRERQREDKHARVDPMPRRQRDHRP